MTENKRFKYSYSLEKVYDCDTFNGETTESYGTFECCDMLNQLNDENKQLKLLNNYRGEMVSFATSIIQDMGSEEMLKMWNDFTEVMYQKWKKRD